MSYATGLVSVRMFNCHQFDISRRVMECGFTHGVLESVAAAAAHPVALHIQLMHPPVHVPATNFSLPSTTKEPCLGQTAISWRFGLESRSEVLGRRLETLLCTCGSLGHAEGRGNMHVRHAYSS